MSETKEIIVPSSPEDRKRIKEVMRTISDSFTRIESEKDLIKDEIAALSEKYELPKKFLNKMARTYHKQNFDQTVTEQDDFETLYETVMELKHGE